MMLFNSNVLRRCSASVAQSLRRLLTQCHGQDLIEYSLLLAFLALGVAGVMVGASQPISDVWNHAHSHLDKGHHYAKGHDK
jgi:Flp pilus assembly pilin Flp